MNDLAVLAHRKGLIRLQLAHKVPGEIEVGQFGVFRLGLLVPRLPDVPDAQSVEVPHEGSGVKFRHHNRGDVPLVTTRVASGLADISHDRVVAVSEGRVDHALAQEVGNVELRFRVHLRGEKGCFFRLSRDGRGL